MTGYPKGATWALGWLLTLTVMVGLAPVAVAADADHLIISEIVVKTRNPVSSFGSPYIQVVNPTASDVDMGQVYITDATTSPSAYYYNITIGDPATSIPGGGNGGDFHARFPDGYVLAAGDSLAISINGSTEYQEAYGRLPDFELYEDSNSPDNVPELAEAFPGSIDAGPLSGVNVPVLSDIAESIILYTWDGTSDLVQDLDYLMWGSLTGVRIDKTGVTVGSATYANDTAVNGQSAVSGSGPGFRHSFRRLSADEGTETLAGGNGAGGHDETSENLANTFEDVDVNTAGSIIPAPPAAWHPSAPIFTNASADGQEVVFSATLVSNSLINNVTFHYTVNGGTENTISGVNSAGDVYTATLPLQEIGSVVEWYCLADNTDGGSSVYPSAAPQYTEIYTVERGAAKLLITEVSVDPDEVEFVEIHNPNFFPVELSDYYLTDSIFYGSTNSQLYWQIADGIPSVTTVGGGNFNDFTARFPDGYIIEPEATITISIQGSDGFEASLGFLPDLELFEDGDSADSVPDFRPVFNNINDLPGNSIYTPGREAGSDGRPKGIPELEEYWGEPVILYHYAPGTDYVTDIDFMMWRHTQGDFAFTFDKDNVTIGGHTYLPDTPVDDQVSAPQQVGEGQSYTRIISDSGFQPSSGSNGVEGRDETGESLSTTFQLASLSPGVFEEVVLDLSSKVKFLIESKTFIPTMGEVFEIKFVSDLTYETRVRIFDMEGRLVFTLYDSRFDGEAGLLNGVTWDGRNSVYERVKAGAYVLHLEAVDPATSEIFTTTAPVVVATRLSK